MSRFQDWDYTSGPGVRDTICGICWIQIEPNAPTITHTGTCLATYCRGCFRSILNMLNPVRCPNCCDRIFKTTHTGPVSLGRDGVRDRKPRPDWPFVTASTNRDAEESQRYQSLRGYGVDLYEYDYNDHLEHAGIVPHVNYFLQMVTSTEADFSDCVSYRRHRIFVGSNFVRWLMAHRALRAPREPEYMRWLQGQGYPITTMPSGDERWYVFQAHDTLYLVPRSSECHSWFWQIGDAFADSSQTLEQVETCRISTRADIAVEAGRFIVRISVNGHGIQRDRQVDLVVGTASENADFQTAQEAGTGAWMLGPTVGVHFASGLTQAMEMIYGKE